MLDLRLLDKDLDRVSNAESAGLHSARWRVRAGLGLGLCALIVAIAAGALGISSAAGIVIAGLVVGSFLALSIGANDVANSLAPAVGAGAIPMGVGLAAAAVMEIAGVLLASAPVSQTLTLGILDPAQALAGSSSALVMLSAMLAAAAWITLATWAGAPVSTTHAIVGGIAGAGLASFGPAAVNWTGVATIAMGWVISPLASGLVAAGVLALLRARVHRAPDRIAAALRWLPPLVAVLAVLLIPFLAPLWPGGSPGPVAMAVVTAAVGGLTLWGARQLMRSNIRAAASEKEILNRFIGVPLAAGALLMAFAHGANDASNVVAPLSVIVRSAGSWGPDLAVSPLLPLLVGCGIALGAWRFGRRLVWMVGSRITRLSPARALCVSLATALTVLVASRLGMPVSTTHIAVGGVFGVGFYREWEDRQLRARSRKPLPVEERRRRVLVRRRHVWRMLAAWTLTVPLVAALGAAISVLLS